MMKMTVDQRFMMPADVVERVEVLRNKQSKRGTLLQSVNKFFRFRYERRLCLVLRFLWSGCKYLVVYGVHFKYFRFSLRVRNMR